MANQMTEENHAMTSLLSDNREEISNMVESSTLHPDPSDMTPLNNDIKMECHLVSMTEDISIQESPNMSSTAAFNDSCNSSDVFLAPDEVSIPSITAPLYCVYRGSQRVRLLHRDITLQLLCACLKVRFGISSKFFDYAGRPRLNFVVDAPPSLCRVLGSCDSIAQNSYSESGSSEWRPIVTRKNGFSNYPTVRLQ